MSTHRTFPAPERRTVPVRRLRADEVERLGYAGTLQLSRLEYRRFGAWWRGSKWYVVERSDRTQLMVATARELETYQITVNG